MIPQDRPDSLPSLTRRTRTIMNGQAHNVFVTVSFKDGKPFEVFATTAKSGTYEYAHAETIGRIVSLWLRSGGDPNEIVKQLSGVTNGRAFGSAAEFDELGDSLADVIAQILRKIDSGEIQCP